MDLITTTEDLAAACTRLAAAPFIAVDTEFMREQTFWPRLCLIQIASADTEILIDSMAPEIDLKPFFDLMVDDLDAAHEQSKALGLAPTEIQSGQIHRSFEVSAPSGHVVKFNSSHVSDKPV